MNKNYRNLEHLLNPSSIALVGASLNQGSYGNHLLKMLVNGGYKGKIFPINPKYTSHSKLKFFSDITSLPHSPDLTVIALRSSNVEKAVMESIDFGTKSLTIFADTSVEKFHYKLQKIIKKSELELCGTNSMGFHNLINQVRISPFGFPLDLKKGNISLIVQSGSVMGALLNNDRRLKYNYIISSGSETYTSADKYLSWVINQKTTKVVGLFLEAIRNPKRFIEALKSAKSKNIPVVILKVGKTETSSKLALSHTGAIVGNYDVFKAMANENGAHVVNTIDEMAASLQVFSHYKIPANGYGIASIHDSGGESELMVDLAEEFSIPYANISQETKKNISREIEPTMKAENPLDAWGSGHNADKLFEKTFLILLNDESVSLGLYVMDWRQDYYLHLMHEKVLYKILPKTQKPIIAVSNYSMTNDQELAIRLQEHGIPLIKGTMEAMVAIKNLINNKKRITKKHFPFTNNVKKQFWLKKLFKNKSLDILESYKLIADYEIKSPKMKEVFSIEEANNFATKINFPIVLKTSNKNILHKTEVNGVFTNINSFNELRSKYKNLSKRLGKGVIISEMILEGLELSLGYINDIDFGPAISVSAGGTLIEVIDDKIIFSAPVSPKEVKSKIYNLKISRLFNGYRGSKKLDVELLCKTISKFSELVWDFKEIISEIDINPLMLSSKGVFALDSLIIFKNQSRNL